MLKPPRRGGSNEYPQSMFWGKNRKNRFTPANPSFTQYIKVGYKGVYITRTCFPGGIILWNANRKGVKSEMFLNVACFRFKFYT